MLPVDAHTTAVAPSAFATEIAVVMPPTPNGAYNPDLLATCHELGVKEVYRLGGAQAVAAMAYGIDGLPAVDMIVGPGNIFVALAKKFVFGQVAIDCLAGPSEIVVWSDRGRPEWIALDLLAQAEHDPGARAVFVTTRETLAREVAAAVRRRMPADGPAPVSMRRNGAVVLALSEPSPP